MNVFNAGQLSKAFDIPYPTAERIIRDARTRYGRRWLALTMAGSACVLAGLVTSWLETAGHTLASHLWIMSGIVLVLLQLSLTRRAAHQPILDAARKASPQKD